MKSLKQFLVDFYHDEEGLTTVEYAVAGALVAAAVVGAFSGLGNEVGNTINGLKENVKGNT
ncbi:Flp family type IVb pilin [Photobacterium rosenbergii]|uniref:Flp family type IVb pilin n=1 Tax=Photobacterium rosenbergii TaxID=294936 RepID=A0A2T3NK27_9GAMM|nr:Flp family type IVb pilin [Photobacterium rosenbergii]PSW15823.1 Flp family type IVb pilin [Photobacterium rosenbergii]